MPTAGSASVFSGASPISQEIVANHLPVAVRLRVQDLGIPSSGLCWTIPNTAYFAQSQALIVQSAAIGKLRICHRVKPILTLVSGKACFLARLCPLFETAEKSFKRPIYSLAYLLKNLSVYGRKRFTLLFQHWQCRLLLIARQTLFILFPMLGLYPQTSWLYSKRHSSMCASRIFSCFFVGRNLYFKDLSIIKIYTYSHICQSIFREISGRISMTHRPHRTRRCAPC